MICPVCCSGQYNAVDDFFVSQIKTDFFPSEFKLYSCGNCGIWFKDYVDDQLDVAHYYAGLKFSISNWNYTQLLPHERKIDAMLEGLPRGCAVLDVGCWTGRLLSKHSHLQRFGIEPNKESAKIAQENGLSMLGSEVNDLKKINKTFDLIILVDVFEHLIRPLQIIDLLVHYLSDKGKLIIITGRTDSVPVKLARSTYWYFSKNPDHLVFLNAKFVSWLSKRYSSCNVKATSIRHYEFNARRFFYEILWLVSWRFLNPNSPFKKNYVKRFGFLSKLNNVKDITMCSTWKDHCLVEIIKSTAPRRWR